MGCRFDIVLGRPLKIYDVLGYFRYHILYNKFEKIPKWAFVGITGCTSSNDPLLPMSGPGPLYE